MEKLLTIDLSEATNGMIIGEHIHGEMGIPLCQKGSVVSDDLRVRLLEAGVSKLKVWDQVNQAAATGEADSSSQREAEIIDKMKVFDEHVDKSLSIILHHKEIQEIVAIIKKVARANMASEQRK